MCDSRANGSLEPQGEEVGLVGKAVREGGAGRVSRFPCGSALGWWVGNLGVVGADEDEEI